jgi:hypothetical protein
VFLLARFFEVLVIKTFLNEDNDDVIVSRYSRVSDAEAGAASLSSLFAVFFFLFLFLLLLCASLSVGGTCGERK